MLHASLSSLRQVAGLPIRQRRRPSGIIGTWRTPDLWHADAASSLWWIGARPPLPRPAARGIPVGSIPFVNGASAATPCGALPIEWWRLLESSSCQLPLDPRRPFLNGESMVRSPVVVEVGGESVVMAHGGGYSTSSHSSHRCWLRLPHGTSRRPPPHPQSAGGGDKIEHTQFSSCEQIYRKENLDKPVSCFIHVICSRE